MGREVDAVVRVQVDYGKTLGEMFQSIRKNFAELEKEYSKTPFGTTISKMQQEIDGLSGSMQSLISETYSSKEAVNKFETRMQQDFGRLESIVNEVSKSVNGKIADSIMKDLDSAKMQFSDMIGTFEKYISLGKSVRQLGSLEFRAVNTEDLSYTADEIRELHDITPFHCCFQNVRAPAGSHHLIRSTVLRARRYAARTA